MNSLIDYLKHKKLVWQANDQAHPSSVYSTGFQELDDVLQGGLPQQGVIDISSQAGIGEIRLLMPNLLVRHQHSEKLLVFIAPPHAINSECLAHFGFSLQHVLIVHPQSQQEALWSAEQCLKSGCCHAVLTWQTELEIHQVKRLQLAAEQGEALHVLFRPDTAHALALPVPLALRLRPSMQGINVSVTKRKGGRAQHNIEVSMQHYWPYLSKPVRQSNVLSFARKHAG